MAKFCVNCGNALEENATICNSCGKVIDENKGNTSAVQVNQTVINNRPKTNGMAIAGFVISLVSAILCCGSLSTISLIFSIIGLVQAKNCDGNGKGLSIAGIIISSIFVILFILLLSMGVLASITESIAY